MRSSILTFFWTMLVRVWGWSKEKSKTSFFCSFFNSLFRWFDKSYNRSLIVQSVASTEKTDSYFEKRYAKISQKFRSFIQKILSPVSRSVSKSKICSALNLFIENCMHYSLRNFGIFILLVGTGGALGELMYHKTISVLGCVVFCAGIILCMIKESAAELMNTSFFLKLFKFSVTEKKVNVSFKTVLSLGIISGFLAFFAGIIPVVGLWLCILGIAFVFKFTVFTIVAIIVALPFLPTMALVAGVLFCLLVFLTKSYLSANKFTLRYTSVNLFMLLFGAAYIWGVINSYAKISSAKSVLVYLAFMLSYYLILNALTNKKQVWLLLRLLCIASLPCAILGVYQYMNPEQLTGWQDADMFGDIAGRIVSFFENPNVYGEYLIIIIMINLGVVLHATRIKSKILYLITLALNVLCIFLTYSRGCWIGVAVALMMFLFIKHRKWFVAAICLGFVALFFLPESIINRILSIGNLADTSTSYRMYIWEGTVHMLKDFWVTGVGVGTDAFNHIYPYYSYGAIAAPHPHNLYLLILAETGLIGMVAFLGLTIILVKKLFVTASNAKDSFCGEFAAILLSAIIGFLIQGVFDNVWYNYRVFLFYFIIIGISVVVCLIDKESEVNKLD